MQPEHNSIILKSISRALQYFVGASIPTKLNFQNGSQNYLMRFGVTNKIKLIAWIFRLFNLILTMYLIEENAYKVGLDIQYRNNK